ncbi:MAG: hypothetical protein BWY74_03881 [Firmicutes bacterium ADurb.Bin419]|nr:MAG: hypothetical protein BWY74_03881 [Firmicutes bacterium ADurb.Bin419]
MKSKNIPAKTILIHTVVAILLTTSSVFAINNYIENNKIPFIIIFNLIVLVLSIHTSITYFNTYFMIRLRELYKLLSETQEGCKND